MGAEQEGDESLGGNGGILYFSRNLVVCLTKTVPLSSYGNTGALAVS